MTVSVRSPLASLFGQGYFNANKLSPAQVAQLFVRGERFEPLSRVDNAVLTGPRGSGKTTFMKMLTREALSNWDDPLSRELIGRDILPLYFGSDVVLRSQLVEPDDLVGGAQSNVRADIRTLQRSKISLHFLQATMSAIKIEVQAGRARPVPESQASVAAVAALWRLSLPYQSWDALRAAAAHAIDDISRALRRVTDGAPGAAAALAEAHGPPALGDLFVSLLAELVQSFEGLPKRWLLLFDEVEAFPTNVQVELVQLIRSLGPEFGVKLAFTPLSTTGGYLREVSGAFTSSGHDYLHFDLASSQAEKQDILAFAVDLTKQVLELIGIEDVDLPGIFGVSPFVAEVSQLRQHGRAVIERPSEDELFESLSSEHARFAEYADRKNLGTSEDRGALTGPQRASRVRKALPVMILWHERLNRERMATRQSTRSRKTHAVFTGFPTFLEIGDGNPRTTLRLLDRALAAVGLRVGVEVSPKSKDLVIDAETQADVIDVEREVQLALAEVYLARHGSVRGRMGGMQFLDQLGQLFERNVYFSRHFDADPVTAFILDDGVDPTLAHAIADAVYTGVLVDAGSPDGPTRKGVKEGEMRHLYGRRYRLSFLLGTAYWLPVRKGQAKYLSTLLRRTAIESSPGDQQAMFEPEER